MTNTTVPCPIPKCGAPAIPQADGGVWCPEGEMVITDAHVERAREAEALAAAISGRPAGVSVEDVLRREGVL